MSVIQSNTHDAGNIASDAPKISGGWNEEKFSRAIALAAEGKKAREIGLEIGMTRSAVICKLNRAKIELQNAPAGGRGVSRKGITKGKGYRAAGKAPRPRKKSDTIQDGLNPITIEESSGIHIGQIGGSRPDYDTDFPSGVSTMAISVGESSGSGSLGFRSQRTVMVNVAEEAPAWSEDRIKMARQLIEAKGETLANAARQMGVSTTEMKKVCSRNRITEGRFDAIAIVRSLPTLPGLVAKETPTALDHVAISAPAKLDALFDKAESTKHTSGVPVSILDVRANDCRYLVGKDERGLALFCGCNSISGKSYCSDHAKIVFEVVKKRD